MTYEDVRTLKIGNKLTPRAGGPTAEVSQATEHFVRIDWYELRHDILNKTSPLWALLERKC